MRLTVDSTEPAFFGGVVGANEYEVTRSATLRAGPGENSKAPALWLLEPYGCTALSTGGAGTSIVVGDMSAVPPIEGLVTVDSNGTQTNGTGGCSGGATTVDVSQGQVHALPISPAGRSRPGHRRDPAVRHVALGHRAASSRPATRPTSRAGGWRRPRSTCPGEPPAPRSTTGGTARPATPTTTSGPPATPASRSPTARPPPRLPPYIDLLTTLVGTSGRSRWLRHLPEARRAVRQLQRRRRRSCCRPATGSSTAPTCKVSGGTSITFSGGNVVTKGGITSTGDGTDHGSTTPTPRACCPPTAFHPWAGPCARARAATPAWLYMRAGTST